MRISFSATSLITSVSSFASRLSLAMLLCFCMSSYANPVGNYNGDPAQTWDSFVKLGIQVRTFEQQNLLQADQKLTRRYLQYIPLNLNLKRGKYPLVIALHGADLNAEVFREWDFADRLERLAVKERFILIYANAYTASGTASEKHPGDPFWANSGYWRACTGHQGNNEGFFSVDDVDYLRKLIHEVKREGLPIDAERIYLMGSSNGGEMAQRAAREMPGELAGVGAVIPVGGLPAAEELLFCKKGDQKPISMMFIYSPKDTLLDWIYPKFGADYGKVMSDSMVSWRNALGIDVKSEKITKLPNTVKEGEGYTGSAEVALASMNSVFTRFDYKPGRAGVRFAVLQTDKAAGHAWPNSSPTTYEQASEAKNGFKNQDINAEEVLWAFLKKQKRVAGN